MVYFSYKCLKMLLKKYEVIDENKFSFLESQRTGLVTLIVEKKEKTIVIILTNCSF